MVPILYEIPLFIFILLAGYTIYQLVLARNYLKGGLLAKPYMWFISAVVFFLFWAFDHVYNDLVDLPENLQLFLHYIVSHGLLLASMVCISIAAVKTKNAYVTMLKDKKVK